MERNPSILPAAEGYLKAVATRQQQQRRHCRVGNRDNYNGDTETLGKTTQERRDASLHDKAFDLSNFAADLDRKASKATTVLYLGYGSNLSSATFKGARGIKPLSQINVTVPCLRLTFDLQGLPYIEPCFASTNYRKTDDKEEERDWTAWNGEKGNGKEAKEAEEVPRYHKDRWSKGLVGVVYEVSESDYAHIIETEGGGIGYQDVVVPCYPLNDSDKTVPAKPITTMFKAHTLFASQDWNQKKVASPAHIEQRSDEKPSRKDPSYAQPSARYLGLITTGAAEHKLPKEYQEYLQQIRPYTITTTRQRIAKSILAATWVPIMLFIIELQRKLADNKGQAPAWFKAVTRKVFYFLWLSYFFFFEPVFGDGLRTLGLMDNYADDTNVG